MGKAPVGANEGVGVAKEKTEKESAPAADGKEKPKPAKTAPAAKKEKSAKPAPKAKRKREPFSPRRLLAPLVPLYKLGLAIYGSLRFLGMWPTARLALPVISIGNLYRRLGQDAPGYHPG